MKELIKPNQFEVNNYLEKLDECGNVCNCTGVACNKNCSGGATNSSPDEESEILF